MVRKHGRHGTCYPISNDQGQIEEFQGIGRDISIRREALEALRQSEERFADVFRGSPTAISIIRQSDGDITGIVADHSGPPGGLGAYDLYDDEGEFVDTLFYYDGVLEAPVFLFARGVVDDGDWFRFTKDDTASD